MFSAEWLSLREPADEAARSEPLTHALADILLRDEAVRILDLASGTGANARYLVNRLRGEQHWLLTDHDPALLAAAVPRLIAWADSQEVGVDRTADGIRLSQTNGAVCQIDIHRVDLAMLENQELFMGRQLVTASALLDLVSERWMRRLAEQCRLVRATALFTLTYNGRIECDPVDSEDAMIRDLVNRHQRTDKGFGPALGPAAPDAAERLFAELGYDVRRAASDWILAPDASELQRQLIEGWAAAAREIDERQSGAIGGWRSRRLSLVDRRRSGIVVGHDDVLAISRD